MTTFIHLNILLFILCFSKTSSEKSVTLGLNEDHSCKRSENCKSLKIVIAHRIYPNFISFDGLNPIFCCPPAI
ncbi:serine protease snake-like [Aphis craccivora]|uniref:Serine protease snake-like n=1 Tax=Aphis craccivora TaxID=307492 RepID=A0A6G0VYI3_APHCR|nr:serine protease snake-like [Aphis craccivora]